MVALAAVPPARICFEILRLVQIVAPAADVGNVQLRAVTQNERGELFARNVGEMQAHVVFAAVPFDLVQPALLRGGVAVLGDRIIEITIADVLIDQKQTIFLLAKQRGEVFAPHKQKTRRIVADMRALCPEIRKEAGQLLPFEFTKLHKMPCLKKYFEEL